MKSETAIKITNLTKIYKLYGRNRDRLKDSLGFSKNAMLFFISTTEEIIFKNPTISKNQ